MPKVDKDDRTNWPVLDCYIQYCDGIERNIDRRYALNRFNFYVIGAFATAVWFLAGKDFKLGNDLRDSSIIFVSILWLVHSIVWIVQILRYREISNFKYSVAIELERQLGVSVLEAEEKMILEKSNFVNYTGLEMALPVASCAFSGFILLMQS